MKKNILLYITVLGILIISSCKKSNPTVSIDPHNRTLINIPLEELKSILAGNWLLKKDVQCGVAGCFKTNYSTGQEDIFSFLSQDTVKRLKSNGFELVYDKAIISKSNFDNSWFYSMYGGLVGWSFQEIKNDTLILNDAGLGSASYLIKKL